MIRIGVDLVPVARVRTLAATEGGAALHRMLTPAEVRLSRFATEWDIHAVAGRLAAKEAVFKLLHVADRTLPWQSIEVLKHPGQWPVVRLAGRAERWAAGAGLTTVDLSISHEEQFAVAVAAAATTTHPRTDLPDTSAVPAVPEEDFHAEHHLVQD
ncbi:holo-ACP synthase [Streptomyces sp. NPDC021093]|uniref:holo-ACP synthase n=1 Tax=Streptomyces sp. NPDC021093 TaxID=3365112 RepID=UPI0037BC1385